MTERDPPPKRKRSRLPWSEIGWALVAAMTWDYMKWRVPGLIGGHGQQVLDALANIVANLAVIALLGVVFAAAFAPRRSLSPTDLVRHRRRVAAYLLGAVVPVMAVGDILVGDPVLLNSLDRVGGALVTLALLAHGWPRRLPALEWPRRGRRPRITLRALRQRGAT